MSSPMKDVLATHLEVRAHTPKAVRDLNELFRYRLNINVLHLEKNEYKQDIVVWDDDFLERYSDAMPAVSHLYKALEFLEEKNTAWPPARFARELAKVGEMIGTEAEWTTFVYFYNRNIDDTEINSSEVKADFIRILFGLDENSEVLDNDGNLLPSVVLETKDESFTRALLETCIKDFKTLPNGVFEDIIDIALATDNTNIHIALVNAITRGHDPDRNPGQRKRVSYMVDKLINRYTERVLHAGRDHTRLHSIHTLKEDIHWLLRAIRRETENAIPLDIKTKAKLLSFALASGNPEFETRAIDVIDEMPDEAFDKGH